MSLPDYLLDDPSGECPECGGYVERDGRLCDRCKRDLVDTDTELAYERMLERWEE